ncbi:4'-phosphopantetheinyl transferase [Streptomyces sp. NPDC051041]|uniref:4'-phosphopantetheinyl transferase n=1 Tax=Streptomyces sp. NPDC051041 TaxID=3365640 RepID=UPI00378EB6A6
MMNALLPSGVAVSELFTDPLHIDLHPQEAAVVARVVDKRRREFAAVRLCARTALRQIGVPPGPILPGPEGAPQWPDGVIGSMTHCDGYRAAAVAHRARSASIGIDAEPHAALPDGVEKLTALPEERTTLTRLAVTHPHIHWDRLLFSAKESVYKAWFPSTGHWLDFTECIITPDLERHVFTADLTVPGPVVAGDRISRFTGRWHAGGDARHVVTAVIVPGPAGKSPT